MFVWLGNGGGRLSQDATGQHKPSVFVNLSQWSSLLTLFILLWLLSQLPPPHLTLNWCRTVLLSFIAQTYSSSRWKSRYTTSCVDDGDLALNQSQIVDRCHTPEQDAVLAVIWH